MSGITVALAFGGMFALVVVPILWGIGKALGWDKQ
jgi:hypothetical protein